MAGADDAQEPRSPARLGTDRGERARSEPGDGARDARAHTPAKGSHPIHRRSITDPNFSFVDDDVVELGGDDRKTQRVSADHFKPMISVGGAVAVDSLPPPVQHEELASSNLIAEAIRQIKAGARLDTDSDRATQEMPPMEPPIGDDLEVPSELAVGSDLIPTIRNGGPTLPMALVLKREIEASALRKSRPAIKMRAVTKPPANKRQPTAEPIALRDPNPEDRPARRSHPETEQLAPRRSELGLILVICVFLLGLVATIAMLAI